MTKPNEKQVERATAVADFVLDFDCSCEQDRKCLYHRIIDEYAQAIADAVAEERDGCAKVVKDKDPLEINSWGWEEEDLLRLAEDIQEYFVKAIKERK